MKQKIFTICLILICLLALTACGGPTWQEKYDLGMRYLDEGNYEEAIIAFNAAIEIDPKCTDTYIRLAEVYVELGDIDAALDILNQSIEYNGETDDVLAVLEKIESSPASIMNNLGRLIETGFTGTPLTVDDITFMGHKIVDIDIYTMEQLMRNCGYDVTNNLELTDGENDDYYWIGASPNDVSALQYYDSELIDIWSYSQRARYFDEEPFSVGIRNIYTQDTVETVLTKLGFDNGSEIANALYKLTSLTFETPELGYEYIDKFLQHGSYNLADDNSNGNSCFFTLETYGFTSSNDGQWHWVGAANTDSEIGFSLQIETQGVGMYIHFDFTNNQLEEVECNTFEV